MNDEPPDVCPVFDEGSAISYGSFCAHERIEIEHFQRKVICIKCRAVLDPFDVLLQYARKERVAAYTDESVRETRKRLAVLEAEERLTKARLKNAKRKDADVAVAEAKKALTEKHRRAVAALEEAITQIERAKRNMETDS